MDWYIEKNGKRRPGVRKVCACGNEYITRMDRPAKKCDVSCKGHHILVSCAWCGADLHRVSSKLKSKSGLHFCNRMCKEQAQCLGGIQSIMPEHYGTGCGREKCRRLLKEANHCSLCGDKRKFLLAVHHIDGNHDNNEDSNLEVVCGNCHIVRHLEEQHDGSWGFRTKSLTPRHLLEQFVSMGC